MPKIYPITCYEWFLKALSEHDSDECLLWPFGKDQDGYGKIRVIGGPNTLVHRAAFRVINGHWPKPCGLHTCDVPACFNPRHVFEGSKGDNNRDRASKGRSNVGEARPQSKLTEKAVRHIRSDYVFGKGRTLAAQYGVDIALIMRVVHRQSWKHVK